MKQTELNLLKAIQKAIWDTDPGFSDAVDWQAVLAEAEKQSVLCLALNAAPEESQHKWKNKAGTLTAGFIRILHYQHDLCALLEENHIPTVILKGTSAAVYYPEPVLRTMGDIDYLVPLDRFEQTKELLKQNGYEIEEDERYPRHIHVRKDGISLEQHRFFSSEGLDIEQYVIEGMSHIEHKQMYGIPFPMLPPVSNGLVLLAHIAQHLKSGLGLRQVIDWMMFVNRELDDNLWNSSFCVVATETRLDTLAKVVTRMCQMYLGLPEKVFWCKDADPALCEELMTNLLDSGNFGRKYAEGRRIETVTVLIRREGLLRYLQTAGEKNWKAYQKHRWLKPFAWIYQGFRCIRLAILTRSSGQIAEDLGRGKSRSDLLKALRIG